MASQAGCEALLADKFRPSACDPVAAAALTDGRMVFDGVAAKACHAEYLSHACTGEENYLFPNCSNAFQGVVATGGTCFDDRECGPSAFCSSSAMVCPSACVARK